MEQDSGVAVEQARQAMALAKAAMKRMEIHFIGEAIETVDRTSAERVARCLAAPRVAASGYV